MEYGLTDIQEYYANTGALVAAANARRGRRRRDGRDGRSKVPEKSACSVVETFGEDVAPRDLDETLRWSTARSF